MFDPSTAQQLAESFALRPGMYVGGCVAPDELVEIFVKDVLPAGATEVGVEVGERGAISLRATLRERLSDWSREWEAALTDPRNTRVIHTLSLHLLRLASTDFDVQWSDHDSVHLDDPKYGPATRDCLHDVRARKAIRTRVEEAFGQWLDQEAPRGDPPWQLLGGVHDGEPWRKTYAEVLSHPAGPPVPDPYLHRDDE